jgi:hypothetical protein
LKGCKSPGTEQIPEAKFIKTGGEALSPDIHKLVIWNKEELHQQCKEPIVVPVHKNGDKIGRSNYRGMLQLSDSYKILSNIQISRLPPCVGEIIGDHQRGIRHNTSTTVWIYFYLF